MTKPTFNAAVDTRRPSTSGGRVGSAKNQQQANANVQAGAGTPVAKVDGRSTRGGFVSQETMNVLNGIINVLDTKYMNKEFTIGQLCADLPTTITNGWRAPDLELNRIIQRVLQIQPTSQIKGRGRQMNIFTYTGKGCYAEKKVFGTGPTSIQRDANGNPISKRAKKDKAAQVQTSPAALDNVKTTRPYNRRPVQEQTTAPVADKAPVQEPAKPSALDNGTPAQSNVTQLPTTTTANFDEVVVVDGVTYQLGGDSNFARRTGNDPKTKLFTALVYDIAAGKPHMVNGDIVRLPKKAKK